MNSKNCLLDSSSGQLGIRLCDFGIALPVTDQNDEKVRWLAPEVLTQQRYSFKSDVYAFGITMIEILTRYTPWNVSVYFDFKKKKTHTHKSKRKIKKPNEEE